jgi:hypothetical protein
MNRRRTAHGIAGKASPARLSSARLLFTAFMLLAFALQSYAVQTHIHERLTLPVLAHGANIKGVAANTVTLDAGVHAHKPAMPVKDAPDDCPLCQLLYGGQYVAPDALVFFLPLISVRAIETELGAPPRYDAVSHSWRGRAPPRL